MLTFGVDKPEHYENFYRLMADAAAQTDKRGIQLVLKPHGGGSGASEEILRCLEKVAHANFKIWYDAGNIIYYTGKDPLAELEPIAKHVTGFCAKDCAAPKGEVMSQFGTGKVDFKAVFAKLKSRRLQRPDHGRGRQGRRHRRGDDRQRARQPGVSGKGAGFYLRPTRHQQGLGGHTNGSEIWFGPRQAWSSRRCPAYSTQAQSHGQPDTQRALA